MQDENLYITDQEKCTGCMACYNICPNSAIDITENKYGFLSPIINEKKCNNCGLCKKTCPINKDYERDYDNPKFYAMKNKNIEDRLSSSSGGIFSLLANTVLEQNGVVYGAEFFEDKVKHVRVDSKKDLQKLKGSKYLQSEIGKIYIDVKKDLENQRTVLFSGTPCQIEGLKNYLNKEYENLIKVSIVCHGVPSPKIYKKYINENDKILNFRNKDYGWHEFSVEYDNAKKIIATKDDFMEGFGRKYYLRESCYNCQMKYNDKNTSDIILGDFWGIEKIYPAMDDNKGVSAVIINSEKGEKCFKEIKDKTEYKETLLEDIAKSNPLLLVSAKRPKSRDEFYELIKKNEIKTSVRYMIYKDDEKEMEKQKQYIKDLEDAKKYFLGQIELKDKQIKELEEKSNKKNNNKSIFSRFKK